MASPESDKRPEAKSKIPSAGDFEEIVEATESPEVAIRELGALRIATCPGFYEERAKILLRMMHDPADHIELVALAGLPAVLEQIENPAAFIGPLLRRYEKSDPAWRNVYYEPMVAAARRVIDDGAQPPEGITESLAVLYRMMRDKDPRCVLTGLAVVAAMGTEAKDALPEIAVCLKHDDPRIAIWACRVVARLGDEGQPLDPLLKNLLQSNDENVAKVAELTVQLLERG